MSLEDTWAAFCEHHHRIAVLQTAMETLEWDARTKMPEPGDEHRAEQTAALAEIVHQRRTDPRVAEWLDQLGSSPLADDDETGPTIREIKREHRKQSRVPARLVSELSRASSLGQAAWVEARREDDFSKFLPHLETMIRLKREYAEAVGFEDHIYDALLDDFEPRQSTVQVRAALEGLREELVPMVAAIVDSGRHPDRGILRRRYPADAQERIGREAATLIGFDFQRGRLDETHHPFCTTLGPHDVRLTTRYDEQFLPSSLFGTMHEAGHGMYEQGLRTDMFGLPLGQYASLGVHESQSRLWENAVGRSRPFWEFFYPRLQQAFPDSLGDVALDAFHFAVNDVQPSLIRVEADEVTYNLHIIIRFELEQSLLTGELAPADAPQAWNAKYEQYLGITPPSDADGVLQDVHWSAGLLGYFPTYSLGNLYAAQLMEAAAADLGDLDADFRAGQFQRLRDWLAKKVYRHGRRWPAAELIQRATGESLNHHALIRYLRSRFSALGYPV